MNDIEWRDYLKKKDEETLEDRVNRRSELNAIIYRDKLPELLWVYSTEAILLYIYGHFSSVILFCASIMELTLADRLIHNHKGAENVIELLTLAEKTKLCCEYGIITPLDKKVIDDLREFRNLITHADFNKLSRKTDVFYADIDDAIVRVNLYLANMGGVLKTQALKSLTVTRELTKKWYGEQKTSDLSSEVLG